MLTSGQLTRLKNELSLMQALANSSSLIRFGTVGSPPTKYEVELSCVGLALEAGYEVTHRDHHAFVIAIGDQFPALAPTLIWKTPIFHPNFRPPHVCLGNYWYPAWSLAEMCVSICEMVQYKVYNVYDPLDVEAAKWVNRYLELEGNSLPIDPRPVTDLDFDLGVTAGTSR